MKQSDQTFVELLRRRAFEHPTRLACSYLADEELERNSLTYGELDLRARVIGAQLIELGVMGERVLLLYPSGLEFITAFFGCLYAGAVAVPAYPPLVRRQISRLLTIISDAQAGVVLTTTSVLARVSSFINDFEHLQGMRWITTDKLSNNLADDWREPRIDSSTLAFLQYTSGSTSAPKGAMVSHSNLLHNERVIQMAFRQTDESIIVGWLPLYHDMGLIGNVLQPLYLGASSILMSPMSFLRTPLRWLQAVSDYRATTSGAPNFAYDLCVRRIPPSQREVLDLSSWSVAFNGAEVVNRETMERFADAFAQCGFRREAFFPCYGLAEATLFVSGKLTDSSFISVDFHVDELEKNHAIVSVPGDKMRSLVSCGGTHADQQVIIVDPSFLKQCPESVIGEIWVAGPSVASGYWNQSIATTETFCARLSESDEGRFLRTGDLGFLYKGQLFITGRLKDLIIIRGRNHYPQDIEKSVEHSHAAIVVGGGAAFPIEVEGEEHLVIVQEVETEKPDLQREIIQAIQQTISEEHEIQVYAIALLKSRTIPKTSSGKIQHRACRNRFLNGELKVLAEWRATDLSEAETTAHIKTDVNETYNVDQITDWLINELKAGALANVSYIDAKQNFSATGLDSLGAIELSHRIEIKFGVVISPGSFLSDSSIVDLAHTIVESLVADASVDSEKMEVIEHSDRYPLSQGQQALWFLQHLHPQSTAYNISSAMRITTELDLTILRNVFNSLAQRHTILRTTFLSNQYGEPVQHTHENAGIYFKEYDARNWSEAKIMQCMVEEANKPFDLVEGPICCLHLFLGNQQQYILLISIHHIIVDFWSLGILLHEMGELYAAECQQRAPKLLPLKLQYADYVHWQSRMLASSEGERLWRYWQQQLADASLVLDLPFDRPRQPLQSHRGASLPDKLNNELAIKIKELSQAHNTTLFVVLLTAYYTLLYRYTEQSDLLVGSPVAGRSRATFSGIVGYFVNPLILRAKISDGMSFSELLSQVRKTVLAGLEHQDYPFPMLVERLQPERDSSYSPLFQVMFVLHKAHHHNEEKLVAFALGEASARINLNGLDIESVALKQQVAQFDLTLTMTDLDQAIGISWQYCVDLFESATIERMAGHLRCLLDVVVNNSMEPIQSLLMFTQLEERQILYDWNSTSRAYPGQQCIHQLFESQAKRTPDHIAVICDTAQHTYHQLNALADGLTSHLQHLGVKPEVRVAILVERSIELVIGLLAILKAGGAYVPLDPSYPQERLRMMIEDSEASIMLVGSQYRELVREYSGEVVELRGGTADWYESGEKEPIYEDVICKVEESNVAYVIYTSGSTGRPKGVVITHGSAVTLLQWVQEVFTAYELSGVLASTSICFDLSVFELFSPLSWGGTIIIAESALHVSEMLAADRITLINTVPSAMTELLHSSKLPTSVCSINLAGEALKRSLTEKIYELPQINRVFNLYGPSEDTTYSTYMQVQKETARDPEIGRPISNTKVHILDHWRQILPVGVVGEIYIGGRGVARGYLNRPSMTSERFVPNPYSFAPGEILYRTGDIAHYRANGNIEYLGRIDNQVKIRGFRIELGEIEAQLLQHPAIRSVVVLMREGPDEQKHLVAYMQAVNSETPSVTQLRTYLRSRLPEHMTPNYYVWLSEFPLTPNGKINRLELLKLQLASAKSTRNYVAPRTSIEIELVNIWCQVLKVDQVGIEDDFFELGGHSLLSMQIASRVKESLRVELQLHTLFEYPTIARLAEIIELMQKTSVDSNSIEIKPLSRTMRRVTLSH